VPLVVAAGWNLPPAGQRVVDVAWACVIDEARADSIQLVGSAVKTVAETSLYLYLWFLSGPHETRLMKGK
jgi:hypothetical protein